MALSTIVLASCGGSSDIMMDSNDVAQRPSRKTVEGERGAVFKSPDIKNEFCGVHINFQFCKCAFHNQYCSAVNMDSAGADAHLQSEFSNFVADKRAQFGELCVSNNGYLVDQTCFSCPEGTTVDGEGCRVDPVEKPEEVAQEEMAKADCDAAEDDWEKYSDIDFRIPQNERSFEAKNYAEAQTELVNTAAEQAELLYETELLRSQLADIQEYKAALVDNLRDNLVKATFRLAYTTYAQVKGAKGAGESFSKFLTSTESIEALGAGMKTVQAIIPSDSKLAIDTKNVGGKVGSIGWNATLEAIESMGDPVAIGKQIVKDSKGAVMPSTDISPEEIEILRVQNLENNLLDDVIAEIQANIDDNEAWLDVADLRIQDLRADIDKWKAEEKARVLLLLEDECE